MGENYRSCGNLAWFNPRPPSDELLVESGHDPLLHRLNGRGDDDQHAHVHVHASGFHQRGYAYANALPRPLTCHPRESVCDVAHRARARASE